MKGEPIDIEKVAEAARTLSSEERSALMAPAVEHLRESLVGKRLGDLVQEMLQMVAKKPELLNPDYNRGDKEFYQTYVDEISRREEAYSQSLKQDLRMWGVF